MQYLTNNGWNLISDIDGLEGEWITAEELGKHLGYEDPRKSVNNIYDRHREAFENRVDTFVIKLMSNSAGNPNVRIFNQNGSLMITCYSDTKEAIRVKKEMIAAFVAVKNMDLEKRLADQRIIDRFLLSVEKVRAWERRFPEWFFKTVYKLYKDEIHKSGDFVPRMGNFVNCYVYGVAPKEVLRELRNRNPGGMGKRKYKNHQLLTDDALAWLLKHIYTIDAMVKAARYEISIFKALFREAFGQTRFDEFRQEFLEDLQGFKQDQFPF